MLRRNRRRRKEAELTVAKTNQPRIEVGDNVITTVPGLGLFPQPYELPIRGQIVEVRDSALVIQWDLSQDQSKVETVPMEIWTSGRLKVLDFDGLPKIQESVPVKVERRPVDPVKALRPNSVDIDDDPRDNPLEDFMPGGIWYAGSHDPDCRCSKCLDNGIE